MFREVAWPSRTPVKAWPSDPESVRMWMWLMSRYGRLPTAARSAHRNARRSMPYEKPRPNQSAWVSGSSGLCRRMKILGGLTSESCLAHTIPLPVISLPQTTREYRLPEADGFYSLILRGASIPKIKSTEVPVKVHATCIQVRFLFNSLSRLIDYKHAPPTQSRDLFVAKG